MRPTGSSVLVVVLLSACTRPNAAYDSGGGDGTGGEESNGGDATRGEVTTSGRVTVGDGDSATTRPTSSDPSAEGPVTTEASATTEVAVDSGPVDTGTCSLDFPEPFGITAAPSLEVLAGGCPAVTRLTLQVETATETEMSAHVCTEMCACNLDAISLSFDVPLPPGLAGCFGFVVELDGDCNLLAYAFDVGPMPVDAVVSNVVNPSLMHPFLIDLAEMSSLECNEGCDPASGYYPLVEHPSETQIFPGESSVLPGPLPYSIFNAGSGIDAECNHVARWHALLP